jgi:hypothetical protein
MGKMNISQRDMFGVSDSLAQFDRDRKHNQVLL